MLHACADDDDDSRHAWGSGWTACNKHDTRASPDTPAPEHPGLSQEGVAEVVLVNEQGRALRAALLVPRVHHPGGAGRVALLPRR